MLHTIGPISSSPHANWTSCTMFKSCHDNVNIMLELTTLINYKSLTISIMNCEIKIICRNGWKSLQRRILNRRAASCASTSTYAIRNLWWDNFFIILLDSITQFTKKKRDTFVVISSLPTPFIPKCTIIHPTETIIYQLLLCFYTQNKVKCGWNVQKYSFFPLQISNWLLPSCSSKDKVLHSVFMAAIGIMITCSIVTILCFKQVFLRLKSFSCLNWPWPQLNSEHSFRY